MKKETTFTYNSITYPVVIEYKRIRNSYFRFKDGTFHITSSYLVPTSSLMKSLEKFAPRLLKVKGNKESPYSFKENYLYLFGEKQELPPNVNDEKTLDRYLKQILLEYLNKRVPIYKSMMNVQTPYKVKVRKMNTRHGSNSRKTKSLAFQLSLVHYSPEIIDSVIVHELVHDKVFNHSKTFYNEVYKYCPNYWILKRKLDKGVYK